MKKVLKKFNRTLSIMLAVAMVLTMVPQTAMPVLAAGDEAIDYSTADDGSEDVVQTDESLSDEQNGEGTEASEADSDEGNSNTEGDGNTNTNPSDEDSDTEEPSESDVDDNETPADEADAEDGDLNELEDDQMGVQINNVGEEAVTAPTGDDFVYTPGTNNNVAVNGFTFTVTAKDGYKITAVKYQVTGNDEEVDAVKGSAANTYSIPASVFTGAPENAEIKIIVTAVELEEYTITYTVADAGVEKLQYLDADGTTTTYKDYDSANPPKVTENQGFKFKLVPKTYYKVTEVKAGTTTLTADRDGVYTIEKVTANTAITVKTALDDKQCNSVTVKLDTKSDARSVNATVSGNDLDDDINVEVGTAVLVPSADVFVNITPKNGYKITKIDGKAVTPDEDGMVTQKAKFSSKKATLTVTTEAIASESENTITFVNNTKYMTYKVTGDRNVRPVTGQADTYESATGSQKLQFTVTANGSYKPTVTSSSPLDDETELTASKTTMTKTGATYEYVVPTSLFESGVDYTFTIEEEEDNRKFTLSGDLSDVDIFSSKNGKKIALNPETDDEGSDIRTYTTLLNDTVAFQISAKSGAALKTVTSQVGKTGKLTPAKITNGVANVEIKATDDVTIKIETVDQYTPSALKNEAGYNVPITDPKRNVYGVSYNGKYTASVTKGAVTPTDVTLSEIKVLSGKAAVLPKAENDPFISGVNTTVASIDLSKAANVEGKTLTLELYTKEGEQPVKVASYTMAVTVAAKDIKIDKKAVATATQMIDTTKTYTVTAAKGVDLSKLAAEKEDGNNIISNMSYANGKLTVTTAAQKAGQKATITIKEEGVTAADAPKATLTITAADLISGSTKAPTVKLVAATDVSFKLTLSAKTEKAASENLYYKVTTQKASESENSIYVKKENDSQTTEVMVSDGGYGSGGEASYTVKASLVHASEAIANDALDPEKKLGESQISKAQTLKTQKPAYEDKLKLKKINANVITGQKEVEIAEPQYSKYTTYLSLADDDTKVQDISYRAEEALDVAVNNQGRIIASATEYTAIGKHKIQVTAAAAGGAYASTATIDITVVRGIHNLGVDVPSTNLYKAAKKAAKVKATAVYNNGGTGNWAPKNKSVKWDIVGTDAKELAEDSYLKKMVTVKNGTVNVDKNFIIDPDDDAQHTFMIRVTAANTDKVFVGQDDGKDVVGYSDLITINATGEDIKTIAIVKDGEIKALPTGTKDACRVYASDINEGNVVVLSSEATGLKVGESYVSGSEIDLSLLTLKSSNQKSVAVYTENGWIEVNKVGKVKLTATAKDGSNNKAELSLDVINDATDKKDLTLAIVPAQYKADGWPAANADGWDDDKVIYNPSKPNGKEISDLRYDASTTPLVKVQVQQKSTEGDWYDNAPDFANVKLSVSGGKIVYQWGNEAYIAVNSKTTITLTDASQKPNITKKFVLNSTGASTKPAFKVLNKLHSFGTVEEQTADIEVTKLPTETTGLVAKVAVDWSAKNTKNEDDLKDFANMLKDDDYTVTVTDNKGIFKLKFKDNLSWVELPQKSYKLTVTLGTKTDAGVFTAKTLPTSLTVSVDSAKKFTFTPTTSYTLKTKDAYAVLLTGKASVPANEKYTVEWSSLQNMNTKGVTNHFNEYFTIATDEYNNPTIELDQTKWPLPTSADCTGYITYVAYPEKNYYSGGYIENTVKITIKLDTKNTVKKYAQKKSEVGKVEIAKKWGSKTTVTIDATEGKNTESPNLFYAIVDPRDAKSKGFAAESRYEGKVDLTWGDELETDLNVGSTLTVKLLIVPSSSYYIYYVGNADMEEDEIPAAITECGIPVSVKVKVVETTVDVAVFGQDSVAAGEEATYTAAVTINGNVDPSAEVAGWSVVAKEGSTKAEGTTIGDDGKLTVAADQTAGTLIVKASYIPNGEDAVAVEGTKEVAVTAAAGGGGGD